MIRGVTLGLFGFVVVLLITTALFWARQDAATDDDDDDDDDEVHRRHPGRKEHPSARRWSEARAWSEPDLAVPPLAMLAAKPFVSSMAATKTTNDDSAFSMPRLFALSKCEPPAPTIRSLISDSMQHDHEYSEEWESVDDSEEWESVDDSEEWESVDWKLRLDIRDKLMSDSIESYDDSGHKIMRDGSFATWSEDEKVAHIERMVKAGEHYFKVGHRRFIDTNSIKETKQYKKWLDMRTCASKEEITTADQLAAVSTWISTNDAGGVEETMHHHHRHHRSSRFKKKHTEAPVRRRSLRAERTNVSVEWPGLEDAVRRVERELWPLHRKCNGLDEPDWRVQQPVRLVPRLRSVLSYDIGGEFSRHLDACEEPNQEGVLVLDLGLRGDTEQSKENLIAEHYTPRPAELFFERVGDWKSTEFEQSVTDFIAFYNATATETQHHNVTENEHCPPIPSAPHTLAEEVSSAAQDMRASGLGGELAGEWKAEGPGSWVAFPMFHYHGAYNQTSGKRVVAVFSLLNASPSESYRVASCKTRDPPMRPAS